MKKGLSVLFGVFLIAFLCGTSYISRRNQMVTKRETVNAAWAQVDVVLAAARGPDSESRCNRERLRRAGSNRLRRCGQGARCVHGRNHSGGQDRSEWRARYRARSACWLFRRIIRSSNRMRIFSRCRTNSRAPKIALRSSVAGMTRRCRTTTRTFRRSRIVWSRASADFNATTRISRRKPARAKLPKWISGPRLPRPRQPRKHLLRPHRRRILVNCYAESSYL